MKLFLQISALKILRAANDTPSHRYGSIKILRLYLQKNIFHYYHLFQTKFKKIQNNFYYAKRLRTLLLPLHRQ
jgi:hypothetical protein